MYFFEACKLLVNTKVVGYVVATDEIGAEDKSSHSTLSSDPCNKKVLEVFVDIGPKYIFSVKLLMAT